MRCEKSCRCFLLYCALWFILQPKCIYFNFIRTGFILDAQVFEKLYKILSDLIVHAESGEHVAFQYIRSWRGYFSVYRSRRKYRTTIKSLLDIRNTAFKQYCKSIPNRDAPYKKLLLWSALDTTIAFYQEDSQILTNMLDEYEAYIFTGSNLLKSILFGFRPENKLWDHRGL